MFILTGILRTDQVMILLIYETGIINGIYHIYHIYHKIPVS